MNERLLVVDASVIIKAFVTEEGSAAADSLWSSEVTLVVPSHAFAEVGEALRRKWARREISQVQLREACAALPRSLLSIDIDALLEPAMEIACELR